MRLLLVELLADWLLSLEFALQVCNLPLLLIDLLLLFFKSVDEDNVDAVIFDAFDLALLVVGDQEGINLLDIFRAETQVTQAAVFPGEADRTKPIDDTQAAAVGREISFVAQGR